MNMVRISGLMALSGLLLCGCRSAAPGDTRHPNATERASPSGEPALVSATAESLEALRRLILGIDGNGIDIRPKHLVPLEVTFATTPAASASSPFETVDITLYNKSDDKELTIKIPPAPPKTLPAGASLDIRYTYERKQGGNGRVLRMRIDGEAYDAQLRSGSNYGPSSLLRAPVPRLLNRAGDVELVIDVHGLKTEIIIVGMYER